MLSTMPLEVYDTPEKRKKFNIDFRDPDVRVCFLIPLVPHES
jgi:hypothetical protein